MRQLFSDFIIRKTTAPNALPITNMTAALPTNEKILELFIILETTHEGVV